MADKIEVFGRLCSQQEIENVFIKAKQYREQVKIYSELVDQLRGEQQ
ncbi:hypothetical protein [Methanobrevibacter woesei]|nr:hypothetical protein [Methanobrevibacter woesei]